MANTTLLEVAEARLTAAQAEQSDAATALAGAQSTIAAAQAALAQASAQAAALDAQETALRAELAAAPMPADAAALVPQLEQLIVQARRQHTAVVAATDAVAAAQQQLDETRLRSQLGAAGAAAAGSERARVKAEDDTRTTWKTSAAAANVPLQAQQLRADKPFTDAKAKATGLLPKPLVDRARQRAAAERDRIAALRNAADAAEASIAKQGDDVEKARAAFRADEAALRTFAITAPSRFARAQALLATVLAAPALTQAEQDAVAAAVDDADPDALAAENERDDAAADLRKAQAALEAKELAKLADPSVDTTAEEQDVTDAEATLQQKEDDYTPDLRAAVDTAEAAVPEAAWRTLAAFDEADAILDDLKGANPAKLASDATASEAALVAKLEAAAGTASAAAALAVAARARADRAAVLSRTEPDHVFAALRGDA